MTMFATGGTGLAPNLHGTLRSEHGTSSARNVKREIKSYWYRKLGLESS